MRHDWIFDVLSDLKAYATANGMLALAAKVDETLLVARHEVGQVADVEPPQDAPVLRPKSQ